MRRVLLICLAAAAVLVAPAGANDYVGTLANGGTASIAGSFIKCKVGGGAVGCVIIRAGKPDPKSWAFTINDSVVQAGKVSANSPAYTSPKQPATSGPKLSGGKQTLTIKNGQNFGGAGTHIACSSLKVGGKVAVACTLVGANGVISGSYGAVLTTHAIQVRTAEGSKSKVLFSRTF